MPACLNRTSAALSFFSLQQAVLQREFFSYTFVLRYHTLEKTIVFLNHPAMPSRHGTPMPSSSAGSTERSIPNRECSIDPTSFWKECVSSLNC
jgi:hypothetical protein